MATRYAKATGNWNSNSTWSDTDGGADASFPTVNDDVIFTNTPGAITVTVNVSSACKSLDCTGGTGFTGTLTGSGDLTCAGNHTLASGMTWTTTGLLYFSGTGSHTITMAGKTRASSGSFRLSGTGTYTLQDDFNIGTASMGITSSGTWDFNGKTVTCNTFSTFGGTGTLTPGSATINCITWTFDSTATLTSNTSTINMTGTTFSGGGKTTYNNVNLTGAGTVAVTGANTFANLTRTGTAVKTDAMTLAANQTVSGTFTCNGNSAINRVLLASNTYGTARTITAATVSMTNTDFRDIACAGAGTWSGTSIGDCGGNTSLTATAADDRFWVDVDGGNWSETTSWSETDGGASGASVPLPQDTAYINANSITSGSRTITVDMPRVGAINASNVANSPTLNISGTYSSQEMYGSLNWGGATPAGANSIYFYNRSAATITCNGKTCPQTVRVDSIGSSVTLGDAFLGATILIDYGTFATGNNNVTLSAQFSSNNSNTKTITLGSSLVTVAGSWYVSATNTTWTANTATIKMTNTGGTIDFWGAGFTFDTVWFVPGSATVCTITGSNTYTLFKDTGAQAHTLKFTTGTTQTVGDFQVNGSAGKLITINSTTTGTHALTKTGGGTITCDYLNIQHSVATPANTWYAGANSTNNQAVATAGSGWIFTAPPSNSATSFFLAGD